MPKIVDHEERRAEIVDAVVRLAGREGLHAVTMRSVAAEATVSLRLVQYYFTSKARLMHATLQHLERQSHRRWEERLARLPHPSTLRDFLETFLAEAVPSDDESRAFHLVWTSYAVLAMTDPEMAAEPFVEGPNRLERQLADAMRQAQARGELATELDVAYEAARLLTLSHGLGTSVLVGQRSAEAAMAVMKQHLDGLLSGSRTAPVSGDPNAPLGATRQNR